MSDSAGPLAWLEQELADWTERGLARRRTACQSRDGAAIVVAGRRLINFGSNDYLNLATDARVAAAAIRATEQIGWGAGASPLVTGYSAWHQQLEERLAQFKRCAAALLFSSGYAANAGTIGALVGEGDVVFSDARNHASLIDGCRLSRARVVVYPHCDWRRLDEMMRDSGSARRRMIATDSIFSMDGDAAPLVELADIAERRDAMLLVDEAHAMGLFGARGSGLAEALGVEDRVSIRIGTLSKAVGSIGGFVAGSQALIEWLLNRARPYVFSTALPPAAAAASLAALEILEASGDVRRRLLSNADGLRKTLASQGWRVGHACSQIVPVYVGDLERTMRLSESLRRRGFWCPGIRPPTVPEGESLLRLSLTAGHTREMLDELVAALNEGR